MPKVAKISSNTKVRSTPYPPIATSTTNMAPVQAADSLPTPASGDRHESNKTWGPDEDERLLLERQQGLNWAQIAERYFPTKTPNACRKRHERLIVKNIAAGDWDSAKVEALAQSYMELREEMWKILAIKLDEKWEIVEKKCMEKGLKTLKNHGRTAIRKRNNSNPVDDDDDAMESFEDSGLGRDVNPGDESASKDHHRSYSRSGQHDQQLPYSFGGVSGAPSMYSGISPGAHSSAPSSYRTASRASSISYRNTPQQHQQSLPEALPGIASIFQTDPAGPRY